MTDTGENNGGRGAAAQPEPCPVCSHTEWDPLEEVIVGSLAGSMIPEAHVAVTANLPTSAARLYRLAGGRRHPGPLVRAGERELEGLVDLLAGGGIVVRRPEPLDFHAKARTPHWSSRGFCAASPRDSLMVVGDLILEAAMSWRSRYFETFAYRPILKDYFRRGARWIAAPRPELRDELYVADAAMPGDGQPMRFVTTEHEPVFDAADFVRCGRDIFFIRSHTTNDFGLAWLERALGPEYRIHALETGLRKTMHIDSTFMPLAPGKVLVNPERIDVERLPPMLRTWDLLVPPEPDPVDSWVLRAAGAVSRWISMNVLMLDEERVIVEASQLSMARALRDWGFYPIRVPFQHYAVFGGSFHCAVLDIRRRGSLQGYFG